MTDLSTAKSQAPAPSDWLRSYYFTRAAVSIGWIAAALIIGRSNAAVAAILLVAYPAWDALANYLDAQKNGGLGSNLSQTLNLAVGVFTAAAVAFALGMSMNTVLVVFGIWAALSGVFQLVTAARRWRTAGAQWVMILSGAQSALAGVAFVVMARADTPPDITAIVPYAAFGAFYFLLSAIWLTIQSTRGHAAVPN
ncbi:DUF308 domain-containing protein [Devosia sp. 1635]|uniref:DUF308 domain-containing protein n=1 Tax=Devosia sp. 1635 TaxID=2726066 RepID=UPI0015671A82|nr:DUF308 domain-containing protein [Devosia sp. 1635]